MWLWVQYQSVTQESSLIMELFWWMRLILTGVVWWYSVGFVLGSDLSKHRNQGVWRSHRSQQQRAGKSKSADTCFTSRTDAELQHPQCCFNGDTGGSHALNLERLKAGKHYCQCSERLSHKGSSKRQTTTLFCLVTHSFCSDFRQHCM